MTAYSSLFGLLWFSNSLCYSYSSYQKE